MISTEFWFFLGCILISVLLALVIMLPWLKRNRCNDDNQLMAINVKNFKSRLVELEQDVSEGLIQQNQYHHQKTELERQLLQAATVDKLIKPVNNSSKIVLLVSLPLLSIGIYLLINNSSKNLFDLWQAQHKYHQIADDLLTDKISTPPAGSLNSREDMQALVAVMQTNVYQNAYDGTRWLKLAELFSAIDATESSSLAMARAYRVEPNNVAVASQYAQALFFSNSGRLTPQIRGILNDILQKDAKNQTAQMMLIMGEASAANYNEALKWANQLRQQINNQPLNTADKLNALNSVDALITELEYKQQTSINP